MAHPRGRGAPALQAPAPQGRGAGRGRALRRAAALALALLLPLSAAVPAAEAAPAAQPLLPSTLELLGRYGSAPLRWEPGDLRWLAPAALALGAALNQDLPLYRQLGEGTGRPAWMEAAMPAVSLLGDWPLDLGVAAASFAPGRFGRTSRLALQALAVSGAYTTAFKLAAWSNRPSQDDRAHRFWAWDQPTQGFPSGHSFAAFSAAEVYGAEFGRWWTYPLAGLVAYSRVYNRAHWPSDAMAGSLLGIAAGMQARRQAEERGSPEWRWSLRPLEGGAQARTSLAF